MACGLVTMELHRGDGSLGVFLGVHAGLAMESIAMCGSEEQKARWLPDMAQMSKLGAFALTEPEHGSDSIALETSARPVKGDGEAGGGWVLNGRKRWIGLGSVADLIVVWARNTDDGQVNGFVVEKGSPGYQARVIEGKVSLRSVWQAEITLENVRVPAENRLPGARSFKDTSLAGLCKNPQVDIDGPAVAELVADVAAAVGRRAAVVSEDVYEVILREIPEIRDDKPPLALLASSVHSNVGTCLQIMEHRIDLVAVRAPAAAMEYARRLAQRGTPLTALLRAYRIGHACFSDWLLRELARQAGDAEMITAATLGMSRIVAGYIDRTSEEMVAAYGQEHHARLRDTLLVFLQSGGSYKATAEQMVLHKNTVQYRIRKAEESLGRPVAGNRHDVELALQASRWLGAAVLAPALAMGRSGPVRDRGPVRAPDYR